MGNPFFKSVNFLRHPRFWAVVGIVFMGRMLWFAYWGVLLEHDSLAYVELQVSLYHPPLYMAFCAAVLKVIDQLEAIVVLQSLTYALAVAVLVGRLQYSGRWKLWMAIALAVEPLSGKLACTVMSETLFLTLVVLALACLPSMVGETGRRGWIAALAGGMLIGHAYMTRYAAPVYLIAFCLCLLGRRLPLKRRLLQMAVVVVGFQCAVLPLRAYYWAEFGTLRVNAFSDLSAWNASAYLYNGTDDARNDNSGFEEYLRQGGFTPFSIDDTWHTNQIFHDSSAFQRYIVGRSTQEVLVAAQEAGTLGRRLQQTFPLRHLREFVIPNVLRPFTKTDVIHADLLPAQIAHGLTYQPFQMHRYHPVGWWICAFALLLATLLAAKNKRQLPLVAWVLLLSTWGYLVGIGLGTVIFLRFLYVLGPLVVLLLGMVGLRKEADQSTS